MNKAPSKTDRALSAYSSMLNHASEMYGKKGNAHTQADKLMSQIRELRSELSRASPVRVIKLNSLIARCELLLIELAPRVFAEPKPRIEEKLLPREPMPGGLQAKKAGRKGSKVTYVVREPNAIKPNQQAKRRQW